MEMNGRAFTVVGILPPEFHGLERGVRTDVWAPVSTWNAMGRGQEFGDRGGVGAAGSGHQPGEQSRGTA